MQRTQSPPRPLDPQRTVLRRFRRSTAILVGLWGLGGSLLLARVEPAHGADRVDPAFVLGYAEGALQTAYSLGEFRLDYRDRNLALDLSERPAVALDAILRLMLEIEGVDRATLSIAGRPVASAEAPTPVTPGPRDADGDADAPSAGAPDADTDADPHTHTHTHTNANANAGRRERFDFLSIHELFDPLLADPRWPRFEFGHLWYLDDRELDRVGAVSFGEGLALVTSPARDWGRLELGVQGGVFSVFDLEAASEDLVNSDFIGGLTLTHHLGDFTSILRLYHQSSHLGDEFLLRNRVDRVNLSFEVLDLLVAYRIGRWGRVYGGGGVIVHRQPALERGVVQAGLELVSPVAFARGHLRPIAAIDYQTRQESDWKADVAVVGGVQLEHPTLRRSRLRLLFEAYTGRSPNGQFYERRITTVGLAIQIEI